MSVIDTLITDRTNIDSDRVKSLAIKGWKKMTEAEKAEFLTAMKGAYNAEDLNRVEGAVAYLSNALVCLPDELKAYAAALLVAWDSFFHPPYDPGGYTVATKTDWVKSDIPEREEMSRYLANVELLTTALECEYPALPASMSNLTYDGANAIEKCLSLLYGAINAERERIKHLLDNTASAWFYSGEIYASEV